MPTPESPIKWATAEDVLRSTKKLRRWFVQVEGRFEKKLLASMPSGSGFDWDVRKANGKRFVYKDTSKHLNEKDTLCIGVVDFDGLGEFHTPEIRDPHLHWVNHYAEGEDRKLLATRVKDTRDAVCLYEWLALTYGLPWEEQLRKKIEDEGYSLSAEGFENTLAEAKYRSWYLAQRQSDLEIETLPHKPHMAVDGGSEVWSRQAHKYPAPEGWNHWNDHCVTAALAFPLKERSARPIESLQDDLEGWLGDIFFQEMGKLGLKLEDFLSKMGWVFEDGAS